MNQGGLGMDATEFRRLQPMLTRYLQEFADCFARKDTRAHLKTYVYGQLSNLERKSVEPIADAAGVPVRTLQEYLSQLRWDEDQVRDRLQQRIARTHPSNHSVGLIDETSFRKKGKKTPGVQHQYCGNIGKQDNCMVTVHLGYAVDDFHCLLDGELFLPESWSKDRTRCAEAGIPADMAYRPKTDIALELYDRASSNGIRFSWLTFDEWYGGKPAFLRGLRDRTQHYAGEVPKSFRGWIDPPEVTSRPYHRGHGRRRKTPRLLAGSPESRTVEELFRHDPRLRKKALEAVASEGRRKGTDALGGQSHRVLSSGRSRSARPTAPIDGCPQRVGSQRVEILHRLRAPLGLACRRCCWWGFRGGGWNGAFRTARERSA